MEKTPVEIATIYLQKGRASWSWDTCIEDIADVLDGPRLTIEASYQASCRLTRKLPHEGRQGKAIWGKMEILNTAQEVVELIRTTISEFQHSTADEYSSRTRENLRARVSEFPLEIRECLSHLIECSFVMFPGEPVPNDTGIYALWRSANYGSLGYVGQAGNQKGGIIDRLNMHVHPVKGWWNRSPAYVTYSTDMRLQSKPFRDLVEAAAIFIFEPSSQVV